ncbi:MAG: exo-alpha-sialidase [Acidobacteria bacterium]|nr:exo-alpha-sialidase [Acidobacteriota bacterium]
MKLICLLLVAAATQLPLAVESEFVIYTRESGYAAFPSIVRLPNEELLVAFRLADRRKGVTHMDPTSRNVVVRGRQNPIFFEHQSPIVIFDRLGMQDPSLTVLRDGRILASSFHWNVKLSEMADPKACQELDGDCPHGVVTGIYTSMSTDNGWSWSGPEKVPAPGYEPAATSESILEARNGDWLLPAYAAAPGKKVEDSILVRSRDGGRTWEPPVVMARDPEEKISFQEPALLELPSRRLLCVMRTDGAKGFMYETYSDDGGKTWSPPANTGLFGHPPHLLLARDGKVRLSYGLRQSPYGIIIAESDDGVRWDSQRTFRLRQTGGNNGDIGYPSTVQLTDGSFLTVYYFNDKDGVRYIGASHYR